MLDERSLRNNGNNESQATDERNTRHRAVQTEIGAEFFSDVYHNISNVSGSEQSRGVNHSNARAAVGPRVKARVG